VLEIPDIPKHEKNKRDVLSHEDQRRLVGYCQDTKTKQEQSVAAAILLMLQCGGMPSEICRLTPDRIALEAEIPHIVISGKTKTKDRPRIVPVVICTKFIGEHVANTIAWLQSCSDSTHSLRIKQFLQKATGNKGITGHGLRHTFRANSIAHGADPTAAATIGGWSGKQIGMSDVMLRYGSEGLSKSDGLKGLQRESLKIHRHLLADSGQVIQFPARA
jgi:integrase